LWPVLFWSASEITSVEIWWIVNIDIEEGRKEGRKEKGGFAGK